MFIGDGDLSSTSVFTQLLNSVESCAAHDPILASVFELCGAFDLVMFNVHRNHSLWFIRDGDLSSTSVLTQLLNSVESYAAHDRVHYEVIPAVQSRPFSRTRCISSSGIDNVIWAPYLRWRPADHETVVVFG